MIQDVSYQVRGNKDLVREELALRAEFCKNILLMPGGNLSCLKKILSIRDDELTVTCVERDRLTYGKMVSNLEKLDNLNYEVFNGDICNFVVRDFYDLVYLDLNGGITEGIYDWLNLNRGNIGRLCLTTMRCYRGDFSRSYLGSYSGEDYVYGLDFECIGHSYRYSERYKLYNKYIYVVEAMVGASGYHIFYRDSLPMMFSSFGN